MPTTTLDRRCPDGSQIPIEQRGTQEVTHIGGRQMAPDGIAVWNPAFDVTPAALIEGWVTEHGVWAPPFPKR
jgi:methylthioribose-1-phosphate isomerase